MTPEDARLAAALREAGGLLADTVAATEATAAPGARDPGEDLRFAVAAIREGHDVHYRGHGRVVRPADEDLGLLAGDALYALGLEALAALGDLDHVRRLADVILICAKAHAEGRPDAAEATWRDLLATRPARSIEDPYPAEQ